MLEAIKKLVCFLCATFIFITCNEKKSAIVFQTDFGTKDGAVNAMKGVAHSIDADLQLFDLTHDIYLLMMYGKLLTVSTSHHHIGLPVPYLFQWLTRA